jgi:hypothetical protein
MTGELRDRSDDGPPRSVVAVKDGAFDAKEGGNQGRNQGAVAT